MTLQLSCRADLFRAVIRFAPREAGVRIEPAGGQSAAGAVLTAWSDDAALAVYDATAVAPRPMQITAPREFVDSLARAVRGSEPGRLRIRVAHGNLACDGVDLIIAHALADPPCSPWRKEMGRHALSRFIARPLLLRRDVMDAVGEAARMLARAAGADAHEAERAEYILRGGQDGALMAAFPDFPEAFALIAQTVPPEGEACAWSPPWWLAEPVRVGAVEGAA